MVSKQEEISVQVTISFEIINTKGGGFLFVQGFFVVVFTHDSIC